MTVSFQPKIAFLFLTVGEHRHAKIWKQFLRGKEELYSLYNHPKDEIKISQGSWLSPYIIPEHVNTQWAHISLVYASLLLLKYALEDPLNQYFILCSETCIPIASFDTLYDFLKKQAPNEMSFFCYNPEYMTTIDCEKRYARFHQKNWIKLQEFMKADQWWILHRKAATVCCAQPDSTISAFDRVFASDEHYFINVLHKKNIPFENRWSTFTDFEVDHSHPIVFRELSVRFREYLLQKGFFFLRKVHPEFRWIE